MDSQSSRSFVGEPSHIGRVNVTGVITLTAKEVGRFMNVYSQTIVAPIITALLFFAVFALALGGAGRSIAGIPYLEFIAPGLLMMTMAQNAFANTSSSLIISKVQGNIVDVLLPPLSPGELTSGYIAGGVARGLVVGLTSGIAICLFVHLGIHSLFLIVCYSLLGTYMLSAMGVAAGLWSDKFDHMAAVTNFVVTPLTFLSGTFYSVQALPGYWKLLAHANPFFYMIDGFRHGFIGQAEGYGYTGMAVLLAVDALLTALCLWMFRTGYKIKS